MVRTQRLETDSLGAFIERSYFQFDFFQLVHLFDCLYQHDIHEDANSPDFRVTQHIRLHSQLGLHYQPNSVTGLALQPDGKYRIETNLPCLIGPAGILPPHYTSKLIDNIHNTALYDFFALFNRRLLRLQYLAWRKYRLYLQSNTASPKVAERLANLLNHFLGFIPSEATHQHLPRDLNDAMFYFSGFNAKAVKTLEGLENLLQHTFAIPVKIEPFKGKWIALTPDNKSMLPSRSHPLGQFNRLAKNCVIGHRAWHSQNRFCISLTVASNEHFSMLLGSNEPLQQMKQLVKLYLGKTYQCYFQIVLSAQVTVRTQLASSAPPILAWNSWLYTAAALPRTYLLTS